MWYFDLEYHFKVDYCDEVKVKNKTSLIIVELPCCVPIIIYGNAAWLTLNISDVDEIRNVEFINYYVTMYCFI